MGHKYGTDTVTTHTEAFLGAEGTPSKILCYRNNRRKGWSSENKNPEPIPT